MTHVQIHKHVFLGTIGFCDRTLELQKCLNILGVNLNEISVLSISWNRTKLKHVCGSVDKFWTRYDDSVKRCDDMELGKDLNRLNSTFNYMCKEGHECTNGFCDRAAELQKCMTILLPGQNLNAISGSSPSWNQTQLEHACGSVDKFFTCYDDFVARCDDTELAKVKVVLSRTFSYMCGKGRKLYLKTRVCLGQEEISGKVQQCTAHTVTSSHTKDEACDKIKDLKNCARNAVSSCGEDAEKYIDGFMKEVPYGLIDCDGLSHGTNGFCDRATELQKCMTILLPGQNLNAILGSSPSWNQTQLEHVCGSVDKFFTCYDDFVARCDDTELAKVKVVLSRTFGYMCGKGRKLYLKTRVCLGQEEISGKVQQCTAHTVTSSHTKDEACDKIKDLKNCARNAVSSCGEDAKKYIDGFMKEVPYGLIDCDGLSHGTIIAIIGAVAVIVALIAFIVSTLVKRKSEVPFKKVENC